MYKGIYYRRDYRRIMVLQKRQKRINNKRDRE
jgi:hypothetical protein